MFWKSSNLLTNKKYARVVSILIFYICCLSATAQSHMHIHHKDGGTSDVPIEQIDRITFVKGSDESNGMVSMTCSWLWGDTEAGYFELLTFNEDKTYMGHDKYFTYGFDAMTYG